MPLCFHRPVVGQLTVEEQRNPSDKGIFLLSQKCCLYFAIFILSFLLNFKSKLQTLAFHLGLPHHGQILYHLNHHESPSVDFLIVSYFKFDLWVNIVKIKMLIVQSYLTLCDTTDLDPRLFCPWNSPGKNTGWGCHFLLQGIFPTQRWNPGLPALQADSLLSETPGKPLGYLFNVRLYFTPQTSN